MSDNQTVFEIIRDVGYLIQSIKARETVWIHVTNDDGHWHTARSSKRMPCGKSETSRAIALAYKVTRGKPDQRDAEIINLKEALRIILSTQEEEGLCDSDEALARIYLTAESALTNIGKDNE